MILLHLLVCHPAELNFKSPGNGLTARAVPAKPFLRSISLNESYAMCLNVIIEFTV